MATVHAESGDLVLDLVDAGLDEVFVGAHCGENLVCVDEARAIGNKQVAPLWLDVEVHDVITQPICHSSL